MADSPGENNSNVFKINATVRKEAGLDVHEGTSTPVPTEVPISGRQQPRKRKRAETRLATSKHKPLTVEDLTAEEVKRRTGFSDLSAMLTFCMVACNGDIDVFNKTVSCLTPVEEWLLYLEIIYGRTYRRLKELERSTGVSRNVIRRIRNAKVDYVN